MNVHASFQIGRIAEFVLNYYCRAPEYIVTFLAVVFMIKLFWILQTNYA